MKDLLKITICLSIFLFSCEKDESIELFFDDALCETGCLVAEIRHSEYPDQKIYYNSDNKIVKIEDYDDGRLKDYSAFEYDSEGNLILYEEFHDHAGTPFKMFQKIYTYTENTIEAIEYWGSGNDTWERVEHKSIAELNKDGRIEKLYLYYPDEQGKLDLQRVREYTWDNGNIMKVEERYGSDKKSSGAHNLSSTETYTYDNNINPEQEFPMRCNHPDHTTLNNPLTYNYVDAEGNTRSREYDYEYNEKGLPVSVYILEDERNKKNTKEFALQSKIFAYSCD